ncbi:diguanylate cyclase (GGDEF) domain-containing protein [Devosia crocina]|uniref:Diguanylate cyclase (GGDEF) domain-containing protein n=1 Tax=Devosia crocina TaxID=429728 RepID=A0A1I7N4V5_9HYPH|nr:EAL domain-containing protein [Devosia crocina]SFV29681.1 diguanylate cyclase (GGDEF) domain-containing protein [Devosia crocina]
MRLLRIALIVLILGFVGAAVYVSAVLFQRHAALEGVGLGNVTWLIAQTPSEFARLEQRVAAFGMGDGTVSADEVRLRFDIVVNRVKTLRTQSVSAFVDSDPRIAQVLDEFEAAVEAARPLLAELDQPGTPARILEILDPVYPKLVRLSTDANVWNIGRIEADRQGLIDLQWTFIVTAMGLVAVGCLLIAMLFIHNRLLNRTQKILRQSERDLAIQNARFDASLDAMTLGVCLLDKANRVVVCNPRFLMLFGLTEAEAAPGTPIADLVDPALLQDSISPLFNHRELGSDLSPDHDFALLDEHAHQLIDGTVLLVRRETVKDDGYVCTFEDVTERYHAQKRIVHIARHDHLTEMPNRLLFWENIAQAVRGLERHQQCFAVLYLDLDRFKEVNDTMGHPVGDELLRQVAERLRRTASSRDTIARLGGDEFALLHYCEDTTDRSARALAEDLIVAVGRPYHIENNEIIVSTSVGIALAPRDGQDADQLMKRADLALYSAKADGAGFYRLFSSQMEKSLQNRRHIESDLRRGIKLDQFELYYQPLVELQTGFVVSGEALMRWHHPEHGMVSPGQFIPLAEETGAIEVLGEWALKQACQDALGWPDHVRVSVNLSPVQFGRSGLVDMVKAVLATSELDARRLELEITESVLLQNNAANLEALRQLRALGLTIALDDFGTGYSSLSYLQRFPFDKLKIDQSFVRGLEMRPESLPIVQSIATLGKNLKMATTAEGVETQAQLDIIAKAGCTEAQGYFFGAPMPEADFRALLLEPLALPSRRTLPST